MTVNLMGVVHGCDAFLPAMIESCHARRLTYFAVDARLRPLPGIFASAGQA